MNIPCAVHLYTTHVCMSNSKQLFTYFSGRYICTTHLPNIYQTTIVMHETYSITPYIFCHHNIFSCVYKKILFLADKT